MKMYIDSKSIMTLAKNLVYHEKSKHINIQFYFIREHVKKKYVGLTYVKTHDQVADIFIKPLVVDPFYKLKNLLGMKHERQLSLRWGVGNN